MNQPTSLARSNLVMQAKYPHYARPKKDVKIENKRRSTCYERFNSSVSNSKKLRESLSESFLEEDISPAVWTQFLERIDTVLSERIEELEEAPDDQKQFSQIQTFVRDAKVNPEAQTEEVRRSMSTLYRHLTPVEEDSSHITSIKNHIRGEISKVLGS